MSGNNLDPTIFASEFTNLYNVRNRYFPSDSFLTILVAIAVLILYLSYSQSSSGLKSPVVGYRSAWEPTFLVALTSDHPNFGQSSTIASRRSVSLRGQETPLAKDCDRTKTACFLSAVTMSNKYVNGLRAIQRG